MSHATRTILAAALALSTAHAAAWAACEGKVVGNNFVVTGCDALIIQGGNVIVQNGTGSTATTNGRGNVILGYDTVNTEPGFPTAKTGSHNLVVGDQHSYTSYGGVVTGYQNSISGPNANVLGGRLNRASGSFACVTGGQYGQAVGGSSMVIGGWDNHANNNFATVTGGRQNTATTANGTNDPCSYATVVGGQSNTATGNYSVIAWSTTNQAKGDLSAMLGGVENMTGAAWATASGGANNYASGLAPLVLRRQVQRGHGRLRRRERRLPEHRLGPLLLGQRRDQRRRLR